MPLVRNSQFANQQIVIGSFFVKFNEEGVGDIPDQEVAKSLCQIPGFSLVEEPPVQGVEGEKPLSETQLPNEEGTNAEEKTLPSRRPRRKDSEEKE